MSDNVAEHYRSCVRDGILRKYFRRFNEQSSTKKDSLYWKSKHRLHNFTLGTRNERKQVKWSQKPRIF
ncbi:hypothetical protein CRE_05793 [Caenorhabditis remanei]|uniref:Uncharacterized protein n=1 Tax=Caenorhabditis remanei TaxID=31234 RepID=E3M047_CAERE|nr:hypothetical protein CRE_05793 [Caenorhabditis remanei]